MIKTMETRHIGLDLSRGISALAVANTHFYFWEFGTPGNNAAITTVLLFFAISSITLMLVYADRFKEALSFSAIREFYIRRVARIMPLLLLISAITAVASIAIRGFSPEHLLRSLLTGSGLMALHLPGYASTVTGAWSIGIELAFYAIFPLVAICAINCSLRTVLIALSASVAGQLVLVQLLASKPMVEQWQLMTTPLLFAPFFLVGILVWKMPRLSINAGYLITAFVALVAFPFVVGDPTRNVMMFAAVVGLIGVLAFLTFSAKVPASWKPIAIFFADISYSLYLTHRLTWELTSALSGYFGLHGAAAWPLFAFINISVAWLFFRYFEMPARQWVQHRLLLPQPNPNMARIDNLASVGNISPALNPKIARAVRNNGNSTPVS